MKTCATLSPEMRQQMFGACRGVVFDCDGVLIDSFGSNLKYYNLMLEKLELPPMTPEQERYVHIHTAGEGLRFIFPEEYHDRIPQMVVEFDYRDVLPSLRIEEGLVELLDFLKANEYLLGIHTNRSTTMNMVLEHFGLTDYFGPIMTPSNVKPKPDPEGVFSILEQWNLTPDRLVFIGDSSLDQMAANSSNVPFWAFKNPDLEADLHVEGFPALLGCWKDFSGNGNQK